jgi:hypothetical protein
MPYSLSPNTGTRRLPRHTCHDETVSSTALALALHDPDGRTVPALERLGEALCDRFASMAINATRDTHRSVLEAFSALMPATVLTHPADEQMIGVYRRDAVESALAHDTPQILYSDADHILRWIEARPDELDAVLRQRSDFLVVGRSPAAMLASPQRLRATESVINHIYSLMRPGRRWDLMFAVRLMSRAAAEIVVRRCRESTVANDVEWPLVAEEHGFDLSYFPADGLSYRTIHDFDQRSDGHDANPCEWIRRVEIAADHAAALRRFL